MALDFRDHLTGPSFKASGKTGATATPVTLGGGTSSGPPTSGTWAKGDLVFDDFGRLWYCAVAGTPGTWAAGYSNQLAHWWVGTGTRASDSNDGRSPATPFATLAAAVTARGASNGVIELFDGTHTVTVATLNANAYATSADNQWIIGQGNSTILRVVGGGTPPANIGSVIRLQHSGCYAGNFTITHSVNVTYVCAITGASSASTNHFTRAEDLLHLPDASTTTTAAFAFGPDFATFSTVDVASCEFARCVTVAPSSSGVATATVSYGAIVGNGTSGNVLVNKYTDCQAIFCVIGLAWNGGSAIWEGGQFGHCSESELQVLKPAGGPMCVKSGRSENSKMFLKSGYVGRGISAVRIDEWVGTNFDPTDGETIINHAAGMLIINGGSYSCTGGNSKVTVDPSGGGAGGFEYTLRADGVTFDSADPWRGVSATNVRRTITGTIKIVAGLPIANPAVDVIDSLTLNNVTLTGVPVAPTAAAGTATTQPATTAFVQTARRPRVTSITSSATPTVNTDTTEFVDITALAAAVTSMTTNLTGTPANGQKLIVRIKDNGTARAITWGASFEAVGVALPTTTVISKRLTVGFLYDSTTSKWGCVASAQEA